MTGSSSSSAGHPRSPARPRSTPATTRPCQASRPSTATATSLAQHAIADQQSAFIAAAFQAWKEHNGAEPLADVVSLNWFNLYDFANAPGSPCYLPPGGTYLPPVCSWGLVGPEGEGKGPAPFTSFFQYALNGIDVNPPESGLDPARDCPQP